MSKSSQFKTTCKDTTAAKSQTLLTIMLVDFSTAAQSHSQNSNTRCRPNET